MFEVLGGVGTRFEGEGKVAGLLKWLVLEGENGGLLEEDGECSAVGDGVEGGASEW